jgi:hypothetical protein
MAQCSPSELLASAKCFLGLPQDKQLTAIISLLCQILKTKNPMATCDVNTLLADSGCWDCLNQNQKFSAMLQILCEILMGGGIGQTCIICLGHGETPVDAAPCDCSIAYNLDGQFWFWNNLTTSWVPFIL